MINGCQLNYKFINDSSVSKSDPDIIDISTKNYDLSNSIGNTVFFNDSSHSIRPQDIQVLSALGSWLETNDCDFIIEGHTDAIGTRNYSFALGLRRAQSVFNYFLARGINSSRMKITSYGKESPAVFGQDENSFSKNRRVVIVLKRCR
ncbi:OmpA family protein [Candidatus Liberibacter americanus]|nr:OmpA family protein [Candidatus Liberibacter americanus]